MTERFKNKYRIQTARAAWHDYKGGSYFVTICTKNREPYFGHIVDGQMTYTDLGISANDCLQAIPLHFPDAEIPVSIVMPNHIHAIIIINAPAPHVETQNFASPKQIPTHHSETQDFASLQMETIQKFDPQSRNLASIVCGFKIGVTKYANNHDIPSAWQPRFHDHIIRSQYEMNCIGDYINNNVAQWKEDCYNNPKDQQNAEIQEKSYLQYF